METATVHSIGARAAWHGPFSVESGFGNMQIAIASGKGGTGKTLIATSLATVWANDGRRVAYVDVDVEEPNGHLFLLPEISIGREFGVRVPALRTGRCAGHGKCQEACNFNAILSAKGRIVVFYELCHSCGACLVACPDGALVEEERTIGTISIGRSDNLAFISGTLDVGEARAAPRAGESRCRARRLVSRESSAFCWATS